MPRIIAILEKCLPRNKFDVFGKESLLKTSIPYYILTLLATIGFFIEKPNPYLFIAISYSLFPILDEIFSFDSRNPTSKQRLELQKEDSYFRMTLYTAIILSWAIFLKSMQMFSTIDIDWDNIPFLIGYIFIVSNYYAAQFAVTHELMHKPGKFYKLLGTLHMVKLYYPHFTYHHLNRHHFEVATPSDPSTSRKGETVYHFIIRCIIYSWKGVYNDEKKQGKSLLVNTAVQSIMSTLAFMVFTYLSFGLQSMILHSVIAIGSITYLQAINYIQHYGLQRKLLPNGQYEKVTILHSWNAPHRFTNYFFFKLQRHSDHHQNCSKPFQTLLSLEESPFLPHGYTLMILMSFFPKVWFKVMDPLAEAYGNLNLEDAGQIDSKIKEKSITETRMFLIEITIAALSLLFFWYFGMN